MFGAVLMAGIFGRSFFRGIALEFTKAFRRVRKPHPVSEK
jgi:hypothetical protein